MNFNVFWANFKSLFNHFESIFYLGSLLLQVKNFVEANSYTKPLFNILNTAVEEIKNKIEHRHNLKLHNYWYNINYEDSFNLPHFHLAASCMNIVVSGVFYIETPKDCGKIVFKRNDQLISLMYEERANRYNEYNKW